MSKFSGKCDLFDHLGGQGGYFDKDGNPVKIGDPNVHVYYSDEMLDFIAFKKKTGGVIYQHKHLKVDEFNQNLIAKKCPHFKIIEHKNKIEDKRTKLGYREKTTYSYEYYGKEYTLKEINKKGVYITVEIHFDTLLDLIPYYPYIVSFACCNGDKETIYISNKSYVEEEYEKHLQHGWESDIYNYYKKQLQGHYRDVVLKWFNPEGREVIEELTFNEDGLAATKEKMDLNFPATWYFEDGPRSFWTSPKQAGESHIFISKEDYDNYLGHKVKVKYVKKLEHKLDLS